MNHMPKARFHFVPQAEQEPQPQQEPEAVMPEYVPESLPELSRLEGMADFLAKQARGLHNAGQMIVKDFRRQRENLEREAATLEQERLLEIAEVNRRYDAMLQRNWHMCQDVDAMIGFYTSDASQQPPQAHVPQVIQPKPRRLGLFASKG